MADLSKNLGQWPPYADHSSAAQVVALIVAVRLGATVCVRANVGRFPHTLELCNAEFGVPPLVA